MNDSVKSVSTKYGDVNQKLSTSLDAMNDFDDAMGPSINLYAPGAETAVGRNLRGLLSNRQTQTKMMNAVKQLDQNAREVGYKFDEDMGKLTNFGAILQRQFGSTRRTSFGGEIGGELARGGKALAQGSAGMVDRGLDYVGESIERARGINEQNSYKSISALLNRKGKKKPSNEGQDNPIVPVE